MSVDLARLDAAIAYIEAHPEEWNQGWWVTRMDCGTACCLAGTVAILDGWAPNWDAGSVETMFVERAGESRYVADVAEELLGLTHQEAIALFAGGNSLGRIKELRDKLAGVIA